MKKIKLFSVVKNNRFFSSLRYRLIFSYIVPIACILILGTISFIQAETAIRTNYEESLGQALNMTGEYLMFGLNSAEESAIQLINDNNIIRYFSNYYKNDTTGAVKALSDIKSSFTNKVMTDKFIGNIYALSGTVQSISTSKITDNEIYKNFLSTDIGKYVYGNKRETLWIGKDEYLDSKLGSANGGYALRLIRHFNDVEGVLVIDIKLDTVRDVLSDLKLAEGSLVGFVTADKKELTINNGIISNENIFTDTDFFKEVLASDSTGGSEYVSFQNSKYLFMYSKIGDSNSVLCSLIPRKAITSQADSIKLITLIIVIITSIISITTGFFISKGIDGTIKMIISKLKDAAKGDLTVSFRSEGIKEFENLINEIQNTFANMKVLIGHVKVLSSYVSASALNIDQTSELFVKSSTDISASMDEIESGITQQANDAEKCLLHMDDLSNKIILVSQYAKEIGNITDKTHKSIEEGTKTTDRLNLQSKSTIEISTDIINKIENLAAESGSIRKIINTINEIAEQTNLLSLNASIEAARAGDAGRGFAIVAEEIRNLAEKSKESVSEIKKIIDKIQDDTEMTVNTAKKVEEVILQQDDVVQNTIASFNDINKNVISLVSYLKEIEKSMDNMNEARTSTMAAIESISAVMEEIAASANTVNNASTEQLNAAKTMNEMAGKLKTHAKQLLDETEVFKV